MAVPSEDGFMVSLTIHDVPEEVRAELAARAARRGCTIEEYVLGALRDLTASPDRADVTGRIRRRAHTLPPLDVATVLRDLDAERR